MNPVSLNRYEFKWIESRKYAKTGLCLTGCFSAGYQNYVFREINKVFSDEELIFTLCIQMKNRFWLNATPGTLFQRTPQPLLRNRFGAGKMFRRGEPRMRRNGPAIPFRTWPQDSQRDGATIGIECVLLSPTFGI